ncbi:uncharacterized protein LOC143232423 [Tachypleus tridentatus]|uniref:uncharacterized protein LOC143232423 n=1 Tax=Tachypleus tridentatus TaxID=6853 RepID=UPI003FD33B55
MAGLSLTLLLLYIRFHLLQVPAVEAQDISQVPLQDPRKFSTALSLDDVYEPKEYSLDHLPFDCNSKPDGTYPEYKRACKIFYLCERGQTHVFWCINGTVYNSDTGHCDLVNRVRCVDPEKSISSVLVGECRNQEDGVYTDYASGCSGFYLCRGGQKLDFRCPENKRFDWRIGSCRDIQEVPCLQLSCENKPDGLYADYIEGCKRYYLCRNSERLEYICPPGKIFNEQTLKCDHPKRVRCFNSSTFNCNGMPDGYYPQYDNGCRAFHLCIKNKPKSFSCPANLAFSKRPLACDYPSKTNCEKPAISECRNKSNGIYILEETGCREFLICRDGHVTHLGACTQGKLMNPATWRCDHRSLVKCSSAKDPDCEGKPDGLYPDINTDCSAYYLCISHRRILAKYCPQSTLFDASVGRCLESTLVNCQNSPVFSSFHQSHYGCEGRIGLFPDFFSDCNRYYICAYGRKELLKCPEGKKFSDVTKQCQEANSVSCIAPKILGNFRCLQGDEGIYMDVKSGCTKWHECWGESGWTYLCPTGSWFNVVTRSCDLIDKDQCQNVGEQIFRPYTFNSQIIRVLQKTDTTFSCHKKINGIYSAGALSCKLFHICANEYTFSYMCPENLMYNLRTESCDDPIQVNCQQDPWTEDNDDFSCSFKTDGMYPDYSTNCQKYFICENGQKMTVYCPKHHLFNTLTMVCELESQVQCRLPLYGEYQVPQEDFNEHIITDKRKSNNSATDQSHRSDSSEDFKSIEFTKTQNKTNAFSNEKNLRDEMRLTNEKQLHHDKMVTEKYPIYQREEMMKEINYSFFSDVLATTSMPHDYEYFNYKIYDTPESYVEKQGETYGMHDRVVVIADIRQDKNKDGVLDESFYATQLPYKSLEYDDINQYDTSYNIKIEGGTVIERPRIATTVSVPHITTSVLKEGLEYVRNTAQPVGLGTTNETNSVVKNVKEKHLVTPSMRSRIFPPSSSTEYEGRSPEPSIDKSNVKLKPNDSVSQKSYSPITRMSSQENTLSPLRKFTFGEESPFFPGSTRKPHTVTYRLNRHTFLSTVTNPSASTQQYSRGETDFSFSSIHQSDKTTSDLSLTNKYRFECPEGETGFFPDYESGCKQFHICYRNIKKTYSCPSVLLFNPESKNCDLPKNVFCQAPKLSSVKNIKCGERMNVYYPDFKSGCRQYYACFQDQIFLYTCSTGKRFNTRTMACDLAETVSCVDPEKSTTSFTVSPTASNVVDKMSKPAHVHGVPHRFLFDCSNRPDGFYPDYARFCHVFYRCKAGKKISHYCKQGFLFNSELGMCDFEENVTCTSPTNDDVMEQL